MKIMEFYFMHFHHIQLAIPTNRYFRLALTVAKQIVESEKKIDTDLLSKLNWIEENTTSTLMIPLIKVQLAVAHSPLNKEVELMDNKGGYVSLKPLAYTRELYTAYEEICDIVTKVGKKYTLDIPYGQQMMGSGSEYFETQA